MHETLPVVHLSDMSIKPSLCWKVTGTVILSAAIHDFFRCGCGFQIMFIPSALFENFAMNEPRVKVPSLKSSTEIIDLNRSSVKGPSLKSCIEITKNISHTLNWSTQPAPESLRSHSGAGCSYVG